MTNRIWRTKVKKIPTKGGIQAVNKICQSLLVQSKVEEVADITESLCIVNCIAYASIVTWLLSEDYKIEIKARKQREDRLPKWLQLMDVNIAETRAFISKCIAERQRLTQGKRMSRKCIRNRKRISEAINETIFVCSITKLIVKLKAKTRRLVESRKNKIGREKSKKINTQFKEQQSKVFSDFKMQIEEQKDVEYPIHTKRKEVKRTFTNVEDVENFWRGLWCKEDSGKPDAEWLKEIEGVFAEIVPEVHNGDIEISMNDIWSSIKKKKNWSGPGPDLITNFWWKKLTSLHVYIKRIFQTIINDEVLINEWFSRGITNLFPKLGEWSISNQRPITCTNTLYKWFTSLLLRILTTFLAKHGLMQIDQRGAKEKCAGTVNNLLLDDMVLKDAQANRKNLACAWVDVRKAYDSLSHSWIKRVLEIHRLPTKLQTAICKIVDSWNIVLIIPLEGTVEETQPIHVTNGVLQGDSICPELYKLAKNPASWHLRRYEGYRLSKPLNNVNITHSLFIDDLKAYMKTLQKLVSMLTDLRMKMKDAGLEWNSKKCKILVMKLGCIDTSIEYVMVGDMKVECMMDEELYRFLGVPEAETHKTGVLVQQLTQVVKQRTSMVWSSPLSDYHKVTATNIFVVSIVQYYMWTEKFCLNDLRIMDTEVRKIMNRNKSKYELQMNAILYVPRSKGGRGLKNIEDCYKQTKIKTALNMLDEKDQRMKVVTQFDQLRIIKKRSSFIKDAVDYSLNDYEAILVDTTDGFSMAYNKDGEQFITSEKKVAIERIKYNSAANYTAEVMDSTWQGKIFKIRSDDKELVNKTCYDWLTKWKECPTQVINDISSIYLQTVPTLSFLKSRCVATIEDDSCRLCYEEKETVKHILSHCGKLAKSDYFTRHNKALQVIIYSVLKRAGLVDECPPWFSVVNVKPYYENELIELYWDIPEYSGDEEKDNNPDRLMRPDGKLILKNVKKVIVLEQSVPWIENRCIKLHEKEEKYVGVLRNLRLQYPDHEVCQASFIMDCLGGYSKNLPENLAKVGIAKQEARTVIRNMQKVVLNEAARLVNKFKFVVNR